MPITRNFTLYLNAGISVAPTVHVNQYDRGEQWVFTLLDDKGQKYTPSSGALIGVKADGNVIAGVTGTVGSNGDVYITETQQMTAAAGKAIFELTIDGQTHGTANFIVQVEKKPTDDAVFSESDLSIIQQGIDSVTPAAINETVSEYLAEHMTNPPIDPTLTVSNAAADAKVTGDNITDLKNALNDLIDVQIGDNLTDPSKLYGATINNDTGAIVEPNNYYVVSDKIPCIEGETLYILWKVSNTDIRVRKTENDKLAFYTADGTFISVGFNQDSYTVPTGTAYCLQQGYKAVTLANDVAVFRKSVSELDRRWVYYTESKTIKDSYTPISVKDGIDYLDENAMLSDVYLDWTMVNRLDPSACSIGKIVDISNGELTDDSRYFTTDFIKINENETLYFYNKNGDRYSANRYASYDKEKNILPSFGPIVNINSVSQTGNMAYIRVTFSYYAPDYYRTPNGKVCIASLNPPFLSGYGASPTIKSEYLRPVIWVYATDSASQVINKMINAYNISNCDVYFERATYSLGTEIEKLDTDYGVRYNEIPIGNNCRYYFNGATLTGNVDLSQHPTGVGEDEFYCNLLGCQRLPSSYELHDGVLIAADTRYVVHDESSALKGSYYHLYQNMEMHYHTNARQEAIRKCIGGGTGVSGVVEIIGCKFTTDGTDSCVSYHGNGTDVVGAEFDINVRNSWFSNSLRGGVLSEHQTARLLYTGNSAASNPVTYDNWTVTQFLNEVR